jgi:hypothetical protein
MVLPFAAHILHGVDASSPVRRPPHSGQASSTTRICEVIPLAAQDLHGDSSGGMLRPQCLQTLASGEIGSAQKGHVLAGVSVSLLAGVSSAAWGCIGLPQWMQAGA